MMDFNSKKTRKIISTIIVLLLVVAMVVPLALSSLSFIM